MTEFSTNNDHNIANQTHFTQPLLHNNSPRHFPHSNSPQHYVTYNNITQNLPHHINHTAHQQQHTAHNHNHKNNQQTLQINSSANLLLNHLNSSPTVTGGPALSPAAATTTTPTSAGHSPLHTYQQPLNSPNNSPFFAYGGYGNEANTTSAVHQHLLRNSKLPWLTHTQYHQHLNDLLVQQQSLQQHQQQVLRSGKGGTSKSPNADTATDDADNDELSEESLKQNVAIVLSNLDRYNNALRSIILNEQVSTTTSGVFFGAGDADNDSLLLLASNNNNFLLGGAGKGNANKMAAPTPATPESDYNSNATTPGSRAGGPSILPPYDSNMMTAHQQHQQQNKLVGALGGVGGVNGMGNGLGGGGGGGGGAGNNLNCSLASSHDFTHDNSDYQWFLDYGYRDGCSGMQRSVLSSLSASYNGIGDLIYYEDLAKNLDANLAEVDMESFRAEDIHSLLSQLPSYCKSLAGDNSRLQQSLMLQQLQQHQQQQYTMQQQQQMYQNMLPSGGGLGQNVSQTSIMSSANEMIDNSICKSELLFSPVKESQYSVDSLDMDAYPEDGDIILTCKANKDNYTIAFEGSVLYSDDSFYAEPNEITMRNKQNCINLHSNLEDIVKRKPLEMSMTRSEQACCNSNGCNRLQKSQTNQLQRYPSGNNNTSDVITLVRHSPQCSVRKSSSLPNLREPNEQMQLLAIHDDDMPNAQLNVSQAISTSTVGSSKSRNLLPMCQMPISCTNSTSASISENLPTECQQQVEQEHAGHHHHHHHHHRRKAHQCCGCGSASSGGTAGDSHNNSCGSATGTHQHQQQQKHAHISGSASSGNSNPPASINLVKLFIKQKSSCNSSSENQASAHTCMDVSSGCWPSSDAAASSSSSSLEQRLRKKSMNDSGKGSALSRHDEEDLAREAAGAAGHSTPKKQYSTRSRCDAVFCDEADQSSSSTGSLTVTNSPAHRRRSVPLRNPQLSHLAMQQTQGSSHSSDGGGSRSTSEQITQVYVSSGGGATTDSRRSRRSDAESMARVSHASSSEMITRSMQTSCGSLSTRSSLSERFRCVPPSFLAKLNNLAQDSQAPIYVIYPNYALPDLGFVKTHSPPAGDVIFSPFNYKTAGSHASGSSGSTSSSLKKRFSMGQNEDEILQTMDYKHVSDWESLATLLPPEYRRRLKHIPEVNKVLGSLESELSHKPLFCMSPPIRQSRAHLCDCAQLIQPTECARDQGSSSSGSSQQPSSGYRGSSTLLTDSELDSTDPLRQMYVYQYDQQQRVDSAAGGGSRAPPVPMPRGILRKTASQTSRSKRNSMIEQQQQTKLSKLEKRRSLQEPPYHHAMSSAEELCEVFEEEDGDEMLYAVPKGRPSAAPMAEQRLSRKDMDARARAENFLSSVPRSELKYYAEIAAILETSSDIHPDMVPYDAAALKKEVSRVLSQQKKVSFHDVDEEFVPQQQLHPLAQPETRQRFATPPNSPNISATNGRRSSQTDLPDRKKAELLDERDKRKIESNRFKRLQIQWELMSKDSSMLKELANDEHTKSGGSTPTTANAHKSRIPRPVSYPAGRRTDTVLHKPTVERTSASRQSPVVAKTLNTKIVSPQIARITAHDGGNGKASATTRSPSRIVPPKRYSMTSAPTTTTTGMPGTPSPVSTPSGATTRARTPNSRTAVTAPNTPKRRVQSPRTTSKAR